MVSLNSKPQGQTLPKSAVHKRFLRKARKPEPNTIGQLAREIESDYQFKFGALIIKSLVQSARVTINSSDSKSSPLVENLSRIWTEMLPHALLGFGHGRAAFEKTYQVDPNSGLALLTGLDYLPVEHTRILLDQSGSFGGIELFVDGRSHRLGPERSWWFALDPTALRPHGRSRYLGAALEVWKDRRELDRLEEIWYSKFAIGHGVARAPEKADVHPTYDAAAVGELDSEGEFLDPMEVMREQCGQIEAGGTLVLSSKMYANGKFLYDYSETEGQKDGGPLEKRRKQLDIAALRSLGIPERAVTQDQTTGSFAAAEVHLEVLEKTAEGILDQIVSSFRKHVVDKAVEINWPVDRRPQITVESQLIGNKQVERIVRLVQSIVDSASLTPLVSQGIIDISKLLELARIPTVEKLEKKVFEELKEVPVVGEARGSNV